MERVARAANRVSGAAVVRLMRTRLPADGWLGGAHELFQRAAITVTVTVTVTVLLVLVLLLVPLVIVDVERGGGSGRQGTATSTTIIQTHKTILVAAMDRLAAPSANVHGEDPAGRSDLDEHVARPVAVTAIAGATAAITACEVSAAAGARASLGATIPAGVTTGTLALHAASSSCIENITRMSSNE